LLTGVFSMENTVKSRNIQLIPVKFFIYLTDMMRKMASFGIGFHRSGRFSLLMKVLAFLTSKNLNKHVF
jgi:hypothetical protein